MTEPWLTKRELAAKLRISTRNVERLRLPVYRRVGGQNRYLLSQVERELAARERGEPPPDGGGNVVELRPRRERRAA